MKINQVALGCTLGLAVSLLAIGVNHGIASPTISDAEVLEILRRNAESVYEINESGRQLAIGRADQERADNVALYIQNNPAFLVSAPYTKGPETASLTIVEFSDFLCPWCARAQEPINQFLQSDSDVRLVYQAWPRGQAGSINYAAAQAAWAAAQQGQFWPYHDLIYGAETLDEAAFVAFAEALGLDLEQFERDRNSSAAEAAVASSHNLGTELGVSYTPSIFLVSTQNGEVKARMFPVHSLDAAEAKEIAASMRANVQGQR